MKIMKTWVYLNENKQVFAFEIRNFGITLSKIANILRSVNGVSDLKCRKPFTRGSGDTHIEFKYLGVPFMVWEPYGDNSRYWIGPQSDDIKRLDVSELEDTFRRQRFSWIRGWIAKQPNKFKV